MKIYYYTILVTVAGTIQKTPEHELKSQAELIAKTIKALPGVGTTVVQLRSEHLCDGCGKRIHTSKEHCEDCIIIPDPAPEVDDA